MAIVEAQAEDQWVPTDLADAPPAPVEADAVDDDAARLAVVVANMRLLASMLSYRTKV